MNDDFIEHSQMKQKSVFQRDEIIHCPQIT